MQSTALGNFAALTVKLQKQKKLVRKIESIIAHQDNNLITEQQNLMRLWCLKSEKQKLALIKAEINTIADGLAMPQ